MASPLAQFEIKPLVPIELMGVDVSFTNSGLYMLLATVIASGFLWFAAGPKQIVPGRLQMLAELFYEFVAGVLRENAGREARPFFPFVFTVFTFILMGNLLGMTPYGFTFTSHIVVTFLLAMAVFLVCVGIGFAYHGLHFFSLFVPEGLPKVIVPFIFVIELFSFCVRPFSLAVRLCANMFAGHIALKIMAGLVVTSLSASVAMVFPFAGTMVLVLFEVFVACLQAYIFALLASVYLHDVIHLH